MGDTIKCPWCNELTIPDVEILERKVAHVVERRCSKCGRVIGAYLHGERFLECIRERVMAFKE